MAKIRLYPSGKEVESLPGDTVLTTLENAGYALPNNCRAGACGECKVKVRSGEFDQGTVLDMALSQQERTEGYGLMCMAKPVSELLEIEWGTADAQPKLFTPRENIRCVVTDRIERTPRIVELRLRPIGDPLRFWPGQYISLCDTNKTIPAKHYSIANAAHSNGEITLQIARVADGATSNWVHDQVFAGNMVNISGAYGTFIGDPSIDAPVLCMAAGTGLAPILALADAALSRGFRHKVTLMFSGKTEQDIYDQGLIQYWNIKHRKFRFIPTLTQQQKEGFQLGRIPTILPELFPDLSGHAIYVAGSTNFVEDCTSAAKALGAMDERIYTEGFFEQNLNQ